MRIACSTLLFDDEPLDVACRWIADLGFDAVDFGARSGWAHLDPATLPGRVDETVEQVESTCEAAGVDPVAFNAAVADDADASPTEQVRALASLADAIDIDAFTLGCGGDAPLGDAIDRSRRLADAARPFDGTVTHETHTGCLTEDPIVAYQLLVGVPGLQLTLDPSHFWYADDEERRQDCYDELLAHVAHVHVRQATVEANGVPMDDPNGCVDFGRLIGCLQNVDYDGVLSVEYIGADDPDDETARMAAGALDYLRDAL